ncbi:MAG: PqqD family protein [bacterium]|nr:PqqD family protein [bacterium]
MSGDSLWRTPRIGPVYWRRDGPHGQHIVVAVPMFGGVFCLNPEAALVFMACNGKNSVEAISSKLAGTYDVSIEAAVQDVNDLLGIWDQLGMLQRDDGDPPAKNAVPPSASGIIVR